MPVKNAKLWGGRFSKGTAGLLEEFNASIKVDGRMYRQDIEGSKAHAVMLGKCGIISTEDAGKIVEGLDGILKDLEEGTATLSPEAEDIHMNVEKLLIERIGDAGRRLHTARSRNDQVCLDFRLYLKQETAELSGLLERLEGTLLDAAEKHAALVMPGYTHLQKAQPVTLGHHLMAYFEMFKRDMERFEDCLKRIDVMPLGSGALAGTSYPIDRQMTAGLLGFHEISRNSIDGVADRDFAIEFVNCCAITMMHMSRFCEELILWSSSEFGYIELDDAYSTGSSIMPQKKNPDIPELIRGKTGRVYGSLMGLLTLMKGLPLAYNKDMQEDKEAAFDAADTVKACIEVFIPMFQTMKVNGDRMSENLRGGYLNATDAADYLTAKGVPFRTAHEITGSLVGYCIGVKKELGELTLEEFKRFSPHFEADIHDFIKLEECVERRRTVGGPSKDGLRASIDRGRRFLLKDNGGV